MSENYLAAALTALAEGQVVGVPTDTVYGLAVDPWNEEAMDRLFELKGRPAEKPIGLLGASVEAMAEITDLGLGAELAARHWPGALSLVVVPRVVLADWVGHRTLRTVMVRVPDHPLLRDLLEDSGPLAVTSANPAAAPEAHDDVEARAMFGDRVAVYLHGRSPGGVASTIVDATGDRLRLLRSGPIKLA